MPVRDYYDPVELAARLSDWFASKNPDVTKVEIFGLDAPASNGFSSETVMFSAKMDRSGSAETTHYVLRTKPTGHTIFPNYDMALQYNLIKRVGELTDVAVPPLGPLEEDPEVIGREFFVMERVDGVVPPDNIPYTMDGWLLDSTPVQQLELQQTTLDVLVSLHSHDWKSFDIPGLNQTRYGEVGLSQQLGLYDYFMEWGAEGTEQPSLFAARDWLHANRPETEPPPVLNWGDARYGNIIYENYKPAAVLDWEMAAIGPRELDLAWMCMFQRFFSEFLGVDDLPGFEPQESVIARYESLTGYEVTNFEWYLIFGAFRYAAIMMRMIQGQEKLGDGAMFTFENNVAVMMLNKLLDSHG